MGKEKPNYMLLNEKPFVIDVVEGTIQGKCINTMKGNWFPSVWFFIEGHKLNDLNKDESLRIFVNDIWRDWCKNHKRKAFDILKRLLDEVCNIH